MNPYFCGTKPSLEKFQLVGDAGIAHFIKLVSQGHNVLLFVPSDPSELTVDLNKLHWVNERFDIDVARTTNTAFYRFNAKRGPLADIELRKAIILAIDWEGATGLVERVLGHTDRHIPSNGLLPIGYIVDAPPYPRDLRSREKRIEEARVILSKHGYDDANPLKLTAALTDYQKFYFYPLKEMIIADLPVEIDEQVIDDIWEYYEPVFFSEGTDFDITIGDWGTSIPSSLFFLEFYAKGNVVPEAIAEQIMPYLKIIVQSSDRTEVMQSEHKVLQLLYESKIYFPIFDAGEVSLISKSMKKKVITICR